MIEKIQSTLKNIKQNKPLVLCLTNYVTMDFMANALLAVGAAPLMSESIEEIEALIQISQAVYINLGTLNGQFLERARFAAKIANARSIPIILDPVGAGASTLRTDAALSLTPFAQVVRGNSSEMMTLAGTQTPTRGVESASAVEQALEPAHLFAQRMNKIIIVSGATDFITDGKQKQTCDYGSELMPLVTGMGCTMTAVISAFVACHTNYFQAACQATAFFSMCGQMANHTATAPGLFRQVFIDNLYRPQWNLIRC